MRRPINQPWNYNQIQQQVTPSRDHMLLTEVKATRPIHVLRRPPEIVDWDNDPGCECLKPPPARVIAQAPDGPKQQRWRDYVKQTEKAQSDRQVCVEHEFCATNPVLTRQKRAGEINGEESLKQKQAGRLPGKNQRTFQPETHDDEEIS